MKTERVIAVLLLIGIVLFLSGCANLKFQWAASYQTENLIEDLRNARAAEASVERAKEVQHRDNDVRLSIAR